MTIAQIRLRRGTTVEWAAADPVLADGEPGVDTTLDRLKIGDGVTHWNSLAYQTADLDGLNTVLLQVEAASDAANLAVADANEAVITANAAVASIGREANNGVMGIGASGKVQDAKRLSPALMGLNALAYAPTPVAAGGDIKAAIDAAVAAAMESAAIAPPRVYVPDITGGWSLSDMPVLAPGITLEGGGYVTVKLTTQRSRMFDLTGLPNVKVHGFTFDLNGNVTSAGIYIPVTAPYADVDDNRWINTRTTSRAVTRKVLTGNVITLDIDNTGANPIAAGNVVSVHKVNGLASLAYADAGVFNNPSATVLTATATQITYAKTNIDVTSTALTDGWVTNGQVPASVYAVNCDGAIHPRVTRNIFTGLRAAIRLYEVVIGAFIERNEFYSWGDRCIFGLATNNGGAWGTKIIRNYFGPPNQKFGDPHQPLAFQGVLGTWHDGTECVGNIVDGATDKFTITNKVMSGGTATLQTSIPHNYTVGTSVTVAINDPLFDGAGRTVTAVTSTTFSYAAVGTVASTAPTGTATASALIAHHTGKSNNDLMGGIADALSFHHSRNLTLHTNTIRNGGEVGITVSNDCTVVDEHDNTVDGCNSCCFAFDWGGAGTSFIGLASKFHDNTARNGGQERGQASTGTAKRTGATSAFWFAGVTGFLVDDNVATDDQQTPSQTSAYYIKDATTDLSIGKTHMTGGTTALLHASSSYTGTVDFFTAGGGGGGAALPVWELNAAGAAGAVVTNQSTEGVLFTASTIASTALVAGVTLFRVRVHGQFDNQATSGTFTIRPRVNGILLASISIAPTQTGAATGTAWYTDLDVYVDTTGAGGAVTMGASTIRISTGTGTVANLLTQATVSVNLSGGFTFSLGAVMATASSTNTMRVTRAVVQQVA